MEKAELMEKINSKINSNGSYGITGESLNEILREIVEYASGPSVDLSFLAGAYNQEGESSTGSSLPMTYLPKINVYEDGSYTMSYPLGSNVSNATELPIKVISKGLIAVEGGWDHTKFGFISSDLILRIGYNSDGTFNGTLAAVPQFAQAPISNYDGSVVFDSYTMTKM